MSYHYSSESGIETDQDARSQERPRLLYLIPNKMVYNSNEQIALVFNKDLSSRGSYRVEFKGRKREKMEVKARLANRCTLVVNAPIYSPPENVNVHVRHFTHEGSKSIGQLPFQFLSRLDLIGNLLQDCSDPVASMCEALGVSPNDMITLDRALTVSFKANIPPGFHLLGLRNGNLENETSDSYYPTLLHFAAAFGLYHFTKDCLCYCPGVAEATRLRNNDNQRPSDLASQGGYENLFSLFKSIEEYGEDSSIYESMNDNEEDDSYYTAMARQRYINVQLWQPNDVTSTSQETEPQYYVDMTSPTEEETDASGYVRTSRDDEIYTDMESGVDPHYTDIDEPSRQTTDEAGYMVAHHQQPDEGGDDEFYMNWQNPDPEQELYEPMTDDIEPNQAVGPQQRYPTYDIPSNLPVSAMYPNARSLSMSLEKRPASSTSSALKVRGGPPVPSRQQIEGRKSPLLPRTSSSTSRQSVISNVSTASGSSASTVGSGFEGDTEQEESGDLWVSRKDLLKQIQENASDGGPPPVPTPDYEKKKLPPTPPPSSAKPRTNYRKANHARSQTAPVNPSDVDTAASLIGPPANRPTSLKDNRQRPPLTSRGSDLTPRTCPRRGSDGIQGDRAPVPIPSSIGSRPAGVPTPFAQTIMKEEESPPPPPARSSSAAVKPVATPRTRKP